MATLQADDIADLVALTLRDLGEDRFTDEARTLQDYVALRSIMKEKRITFGSGYGMQYNVVVDNSGGASWVGLFEVDNINVGDVVQQGTVPFRHGHTAWALDMHEIDMNSGSRQIVDLIKVRKFDADLALALQLEQAFWGVPGSGDTTVPFGVDYWITKNATTGFNGGNHTNFSGGKGGISASTYTRHKNYTAQYTNITRTDLVRKWRRAYTFTQWRSVVPHADYSTGDADYGFYCNYDVLGPLEEMLEAQNDNLGTDLARYDGQTAFRRIPVTWVPELDSDSQDPVYGINWGSFKTAFLNNWNMRTTGPTTASNQHNVLHWHVDVSLNWICYDLRKQFILNKA